MCLGSSSHDRDYDRRRPRLRPRPQQRAPQRSSHRHEENIEMRTPRHPPRTHTGQSSSSHRRRDSHSRSDGHSISRPSGSRGDPYLSNALRVQANPRNHLHDAFKQLGVPTHGRHGQGRLEITYPTGQRRQKAGHLPSRNSRSKKYKEPPAWDEAD